jgi:rhodanese-related sulfurtransferase
MSKGRNKGAGSYSSGAKRGGTAARSPAASPSRSRLYLAIAAGIAALLVVFAVGFVVLGQAGSGSSPSQVTGEAIFQGNGGHWTNVTPDRLAQMMTQKDFTLVNVKTPYIGEIQGTDLYIPYDQISGRAAELPANKTAKILLYCLTGHSSAVAAQTLLDLGYTNVWNLDGGMQAWQASGRTLVNLNRQ